MKRLLLQVLKKKIQLKNFYRRSHEGKEKKGETSKPITDNTTKTISSLEERKRRNTSLPANIARKPIILKLGVGSRMCSVEIVSNLFTYRNFAKPE